MSKVDNKPGTPPAKAAKPAAAEKVEAEQLPENAAEIAAQIDFQKCQGQSCFYFVKKSEAAKGQGKEFCEPWGKEPCPKKEPSIHKPHPHIRSLCILVLV
eukprot:3823960-Amphidinium_carterae.1